MTKNQDNSLLTLATMMFSDCAPKTPCPAYLFTETKDNEASVLRKGAELLRRNAVTRLLILDAESGAAGYPGATAWQEELIRRGVARRAIQLIPIDAPVLNTATEAENLVCYAQKQNLSGLIIAAPPFHQLRCFISVITALKKHRVDTKLKIYNQPGAALPWAETVIHSQGTLKASREGLVEEEAQRIWKYAEKGDLVHPNEALRYLKWRGV